MAADLRVHRGESGLKVGFGDAGLKFNDEVVSDKEGHPAGLNRLLRGGGGGLLLAKQGVFNPNSEVGGI
jgi:hypothetical protein